MSELKARPKGPPTRREIRNAAKVAAALLDMTPQEQLDALAFVCRALWDGRLEDPEFLALCSERQQRTAQRLAGVQPAEEAFNADFEALRAESPDGKVPFGAALKLAQKHGMMTDEMLADWAEAMKEEQRRQPAGGRRQPAEEAG